MATTQADVDALAAVIGTGVLTVTYDGPPRRSVTYQNAADMERTLARMRSELVEAAAQAAGSTVRYRLAATRKGF